MNYKKNTPLLLLILMGVTACAQQKNRVRKAELFTQVHLPGNIAVNEKGEPLTGPDTMYTLLVETNGKAIEWKEAYVKNKTFSVAPMQITTFPYEAGINKADGQKIVRTPARGNQLWLLELLPAETDSGKRISLEKPDTMLLKGQSGKTVFTTIIYKQTELQTLPAY